MADQQNNIQKLEALDKELEEMIGKGDIDLSAYGSPDPEKKDNMYRFFSKLLDYVKPWKVGNLKEEEVGKSRMSVKSYLELAAYAEAEGLTLVSTFFNGNADIIASVSMGRKGFMAQNFVTTIKKEKKMTDTEPKKRGLFGGGGKPNEQEQ